MKRCLLIILCLMTFMAVWGSDFPSRPTINNKKLRTEEQLASYTYSLADTLTYELQDKYLAEYTYLDNKVETVVVKELFDNGWLEIETYQYQYAEDKITEELYQIYNSGWVNYQRESYAYNEENLLLDYQLDNWSNDAWSPYLHIDYIYDTDGSLVNEEWIYYSSRLVDTEYSLSYQYDSQGRISGELWTYSTDSTNWINYLNLAYERNDNDSIIHEDWKYWSDPSWISYLQYNHTFNSFNKIEYTEGLSLVNNQWQYYDNYAYSYNNNENTSQLLAKLWSTDIADWVNSYKYTYTYQDLVSNDNNDVAVNNFNVNVFPNPFSNEAKYDSKQKISKVSVYNLKGQKISSSLLNDKSGTLPNLNEYPNGIYFFKFEDDKGNVAVTKKSKIKN